MQHYRTRFTLKATGKRSALDAALDVVRGWAIESARNMNCTEALAVLEGDGAFCSGVSAYPAHWHGSTAIELPFAFATARFDAAGSCAWAFEMDKLDGASKMKMRRWHTRIGILGNAESVTVNIQITHRIRTGFFGEVELPFANVPRIVLYDMAFNEVDYEGEFSQAFQNETGFELALKEGGQTKKNGKMMDKRSVEFDGKEYGMQMHVKGRNPKIGFRLYCEPDKERGIIVIGHCGHHLETAGTARRAVNK